MKCLIIGGNRFVGLRVSGELHQRCGKDFELHVLNRTGQVAFCPQAVVHKGDRRHLSGSYLDHDWDVIIDFANFTLPDAEEALRHFTRVGRYILISTASVYDRGGEFREGAFDPRHWPLFTPEDKAKPYQDGKRRVEALFAQKAQFPVLTVRFPFILGPDDYTQRLTFHVDRVMQGESIYVPQPEARVSMIHSADAAQFLVWAIQQTQLTGPLNVASPAAISLRHFIEQIASVCNTKVDWSDIEHQDNHSPYGVEGDLVLNVDRMHQAGFQTRPISEWLPSLITAPPIRRGGNDTVH